MGDQVSPEEERRYTEIIDGILATANLETISRKKIREGLEIALGGKDLREQKVSMRSVAVHGIHSGQLAVSAAFLALAELMGHGRHAVYVLIEAPQLTCPEPPDRHQDSHRGALRCHFLRPSRVFRACPAADERQLAPPLAEATREWPRRRRRRWCCKRG